MKKQKDKLDEAVKALQNDTITTGPPKEVSDATLEKLKEAAPAKAGESITISERIKASKRLIQFGAAAVIIIVVGLILISVFAGPEGQEVIEVARERKALEAEGVSETTERDLEIAAERLTARLQEELESIEEFFAAGDVGSLIAMLDEGMYESKIAAANYLEKIGDSRAITALEELSLRYRDDEAGNPFVRAIEQIIARVQAEEMKLAEQSTDIIQPQPAAQKEVSAETGIISEQKNIHGWLMDADGNPVAGTIQLGDLTATAEEDGSFAIAEPDYKEQNSFVGQAFGAGQDLGSLFVWSKDDDINNAEIIVEPLASVSGLVVDANAEPVTDFELKIFALSKERLTSQSEVGEDAWESQIYPDGSFDINSIPTGVDLRLTIEKPGYKTAIDLDGLSAGENLELGQIALEPTEERGQDTQWNCSVEGFIINENNEPLAGAKINTGDVGERRFEAETDAGGWYKLTNLPKDVEIKMFAFAEGYGNNPFTYNCSEPNNTADIQIFPPAYDWYDKPAPPLFVERWFNSEPIALEELAGQVILLHVGVNLKERPEEIRELKELSETYAESPLVFIAIHERARDITEDDIQQFLEENDVNFPFGIDQQSDVVTDMMLPKSRPQEENLVRPARRELQGTGATCSMYEVKAARTYYLIDKNGLLRISPTQTNLEEWIEYLLNE
jgi:hypothetical protein